MLEWPADVPPDRGADPRAEELRAAGDPCPDPGVDSDAERRRAAMDPSRDPHVEELRAAVERYCARPKAGREPGRVADEMIGLRPVIDRLELEFAESAGAFAGTDEYEERGSVSPIDWIRHQCRMSGHAAAERVAVGEQLPRLPESATALRTGEIGYGHLALLARTAEALAEPPGRDRFDEGLLLEQARRCSVGRFRFVCLKARHAADPEGFAGAEALSTEARRLELTSGEDGSLWLRGRLDPVGGATVRTALEPLARPSGAGDDRDRERRLADALVELSHHGLDIGVVPRRAGQRPHLQVTTTLETLLGRLGAPAADLELSLPISAVAVERLACDCAVTRVLLGADSAVIDVGRSRRVVPGATRRALTARDGGCRWPGCERPASWTAAHHLVHWSRGGPTDMDNLVLICARHHWLVHEGGWQLVRDDEGRLLTIPRPVGELARPPGGRAIA